MYCAFNVATTVVRHLQYHVKYSVSQVELRFREANTSLYTFIHIWLYDSSSCKKSNTNLNLWTDGATSIPDGNNVIVHTVNISISLVEIMLNAALFNASHSIYVIVQERTQLLHVRNIIPSLKIHSLADQSSIKNRLRFFRKSILITGSHVFVSIMIHCTHHIIC